MSILDRGALEDSPLADLHAIASELSIDGFRRLRKADLIAAILARQEGSTADAEQSDDAEPASDTEQDGDAGDAAAEPKGRRRGRRGGRGRGAAREEAAADAETADADEAEPEPAGSSDEPAEDELVEGVVELLANGSGFVRVSPPDPSDGDVYISAAQVKRCELITGDRIAGPRRLPRRSERFASLIRIDTINGRPASEVADGGRYDDLAAELPTERFRLSSDDPTLKAIEWLTPIGRGSRVTIVGPARSGKSEALRLLGEALSSQEGVTVFAALAGVRPEEMSGWSAGELKPAAAVGLGASTDAQDHAVELVVDQARRIAARGAEAVVLIDSLDGLHTQSARKALAAARNIVDGGSLTVIATASAPLGGETTVIALDLALASTGRFPALDLVASGTIRPELLVGDAGAQAIAQARADALT